jgi:hypothetical protein
VTADPEPTAGDVAGFMANQLERDGTLYQEVVVSAVVSQFGESFTSLNANGNMALAPEVLKAFNKITPDVVWVRSERMWRKRDDFDLPGRQQP